MKLSEYFGWKVKLGIFLVILSALLYVANYFIFHDLHGVLFYIGIDIAFLPIEILFVVLVIENAISSREKKQMMEKLNMVKAIEERKGKISYNTEIINKSSKKIEIIFNSEKEGTVLSICKIQE